MLATGEDAANSFGAFMLRRMIAVRDLSSLPGCGPGLYRIGVRSRADNERIVEAARAYHGATRE
jgi:histidinol-phosphate/aromatic aminotransferase/cobyric acid decarboxylase-like protein